MAKVDTAREMAVVTKAKELYNYVIIITDKAPKRFRFSLSAELMKLSLSVIEKIYRANEVFIDGVGDRDRRLQLRFDYQIGALTDVKMLGYIAMLAAEHKCILDKQYKLVSQYVSDCQCMLAAWIRSDSKRYGRT